jgi:hypothetical protein
VCLLPLAAGGIGHLRHEGKKSLLILIYPWLKKPFLYQVENPGQLFVSHWTSEDIGCLFLLHGVFMKA